MIAIRAVIALLLALLFAVTGYNLFAAESLGHDYTYFLPRLVYGYFWLQENGMFVVPWFTPAFCGGLPFYADPQVMYYSLPQVLTALFGPILGLQISYILFGAVGAGGMYLLLRNSFNVGSSLAIIGAALFAFNEFYLFRMLAGHLTYHVFPLTPVIALLMTTAANRAALRVPLIAAAGLAIAYIVHGGALNFLVPMMLSVAMLVLLYLLRNPAAARPLIVVFCLASLLGFLMSASKLSAGYAFVRWFPRDGLPLAVFSDFPEMLFSVFKLLFMNPLIQLREIEMNYVVQAQELRFGVSVIPLVLLAFGALSLPRLSRLMTPWRWCCVVMLGLAFFLPMLLTVSLPGLEAFLKQLPYFREMSLAIRWLALLIAPVIVITVVLASEALREIEQPGRALTVEALLLAGSGIVLAATLIYTDPGVERGYEPDRLLAAHAAVATGAAPPPVQRVVDVEAKTFLGVDDVFVDGASSQICYQPLFGYGLDKYPLGSLREGAALSVTQDRLNVKNPACYLYPDANQCAPGDHFDIQQRDSAAAFLANRPFEWQQPAVQVLANYVSLVTFVLVVLLLAIQPLSLIRRP